MRALRPSRPIGNLSSQTCVGPSLPSHNGKLLCSMVFLLLSKPLTSLSPLVLRCKLLRIAAQDSHGAAGHDTWTAQELKYLPLDVFNTVSELLRAFATARDVCRSSYGSLAWYAFPKMAKFATTASKLVTPGQSVLCRCGGAFGIHQSVVAPPFEPGFVQCF